ncbi:MAG: Lrp/AsnC family transcriptional regulator [Pseudomonadota bacterium]
MHSDIDRNILSLLQQDATQTAAQIGQQVGLSQAAAYRRIQRLEADGYIVRRVAILDGDKVGVGIMVIALVRLTAQGRTNIEAFTSKIRAMRNVIECFVVLGDQDFFLKIAVKNIYDYEQFFLKELSVIEGVAEIKSIMTLSTIKNETALPL